MILTENKIQVTDVMMIVNNLVRGQEYGIPVDSLFTGRRLKWKHISEMGQEDFDSLETYFLLKQNQKLEQLEVTQSRAYNFEDLNELIKSQPANFKKGEISDGYHTFNELYEHRNTLFITLCRLMYHTGLVWKKPIEDGWFLLGIGIEPGKQISYHLPESLWSLTDFIRINPAPKVQWDGHTSNDVIKRLKEL